MPATVILTRPAGRNEGLAQSLAAHGVASVILPALVLTPTETPTPPPQLFDLVMFVSGFAVECYLKALGKQPWPNHTLAAGVGSGTRHALLRSGLVPEHAIITPAPSSLQDSEALWQTLRARRLTPQRVLIVRAAHGRDWLQRQWQAAGAQVQTFVAYHRHPAVWSAAQGKTLSHACTHGGVLLVSSADSAHAIDANLRRLGLSALWEKLHVLTQHPRIAQCVAQLLHAADLNAQEITLVTPDAQAMLSALQEYAQTEVFSNTH